MYTYDQFANIPNVEALRDEGLTLACLVATSTGMREVRFSPWYIGDGSGVRVPGDRGTLVIPRWLARELKLSD